MDNPESLDRSSIDEPIPANGDNSFAAELPHNTDHEPVQHQIPPVSDGTAQAFDSVIHSDVSSLHATSKMMVTGTDLS